MSVRGGSWIRYHASDLRVGREFRAVHLIEPSEPSAYVAWGTAAHACVNIHVHIYIHTYTSMYTYASLNTHTHIHIYTLYTPLCMRIYICTRLFCSVVCLLVHRARGGDPSGTCRTFGKLIFVCLLSVCHQSSFSSSSLS